MKTCISTYSYHRLYQQSDFTMFDAIDQTKKFGMDAVELVLSDNSAPTGETLESFAKKLTEYAKGLGLDVPIYTTSANFLCEDPEAEVSRICRHVDIAAACQIPCLRFDITFNYPKNYPVKVWQNVVRDTAPYVRRTAEYAMQKGVVVCSENHGFLMQDSTRLEAMFAEVNHKNYKWLCDIGNFICADEDLAVAVGRLRDMVVHVHAKDVFLRSGMVYNPGEGWMRTRSGNFIRPTILGHGDVPVYQSLGILHRAGYKGCVSIEFEGIEDNIDALRISAQNLIRMLGDLKA